MLRFLPIASGPYKTFFDVRYSWGGFVIVVLFTAGWVLGIAAALRVRKTRSKSRERVFAGLWLVAWTLFGGLALGAVWLGRFHCIRELQTGNFRVVEGPVTRFYPEHGKASEELTVGGITFTYFSASLGGGGLRWTGGRSGPLRVGADVRIAYDSQGEILRLEVRQASP